MSSKQYSYSPPGSQASWQVFTGSSIRVTLGGEWSGFHYGVGWALTVKVGGREVTKWLESDGGTRRNPEVPKRAVPNGWMVSTLNGQPVSPSRIWEMARFNPAMIRVCFDVKTIRPDDRYGGDAPPLTSGDWLMKLIDHNPKAVSMCLDAVRQAARTQSSQRIQNFHSGNDKCLDIALFALPTDREPEKSGSVSWWDIYIQHPNGERYKRALMKAPSRYFGSNTNLGWGWSERQKGELCDPCGLWLHRRVRKDFDNVQILVDKHTPLDVPWILLRYNRKGAERAAAAQKKMDEKAMNHNAGLEIAEARAKAAAEQYAKERPQERERDAASLAVMKAAKQTSSRPPLPTAESGKGSYAGSLTHTAQRRWFRIPSAARGLLRAGMGPPPPYRAGRQDSSAYVSSASADRARSGSLGSSRSSGSPPPAY